MATYSIVEAQGRLSELVEQVLAGEEVTLTRDGAPVVEIRPRQSRSASRFTSDFIDEIAADAKRLSLNGESAATLVRVMRDERE